MMRVVDEHVFPFLRKLGEDGSSYGKHMKDARLGIASSNTLSKVVDMLDKIPMEDRDTKGDIYEFMLGKIASAGTNGQFRTPRHIIQLMVHLMKPTPSDLICDPAAGTGGFLIWAGEYLREQHPEMLRNSETSQHFHNNMFNGFEFDATMLRIGSMNMTLHGIENPKINYRDSLAEGDYGDEGKYSLILANPPFAGSLDYEASSKDLQKLLRLRKLNCYLWLFSFVSCELVVELQWWFQMGYCLALQKHTKTLGGFWLRIINWMPLSAFLLASSNLMQVFLVPL